MLNRCVCTTIALHTYIYVTVDEAKHPEESLHHQTMYIGLLHRAVVAMRTSEDQRVMMVGVHGLDVDSGGQLAGFRQCLQSLHKLVSDSLMSEWAELHRLGSVSSPITRDTLALHDVAMFVLTCQRQYYLVIMEINCRHFVSLNLGTYAKLILSV